MTTHPHDGEDRPAGLDRWLADQLALIPPLPPENVARLDARCADVEQGSPTLHAANTESDQV